MYNNYIQNGVIIAPNVLAEGDKATVKYKGLLYNSGADAVYMRMGFGSGWTNETNVKMARTQEGFEAEIPVTSTDKLNLAFKDSASNWDNNSGSNYSFNVESKYL
ncbi:carbohydrate-binding protein [Acetivibrio cellulolyticus]|uniref:carbohydrate-binding protein n=1 Tax=Acetivibrio cellulolyticus TaxID=35830 RepID=UPI0001E2E74A|nr:carbohydrate-binding protein [Acetivibrio cellulolyticus]